MNNKEKKNIENNLIGFATEKEFENTGKSLHLIISILITKIETLETKVAILEKRKNVV